MALYSGLKKREWNYVDVMGQDGLFHYGKVIDCTPSGFSVDFGCGAGAQLIPFGRIYHSNWEKFFAYEVEEPSPLPLQVLWRANPQEPAKWHPGTLLASHEAAGSWTTDRSHGYGFVRIHLPSGAVTAFLPERRIRREPGDASLCELVLEDGDYFAVQMFELTQPCDSALRKQLIDVFDCHCVRFGMKAIRISDNKLYVLKITAKFRCQFDQRFRGVPEVVDENMVSRLLGTLLADRTSEQGRKREHSEVDDESKSSDNSTSPLAVHGAARKRFPGNLLVEIFQCLDARQQAEFRRVSSHWNALLTSPSVARILRVPNVRPGWEAIPPTCLLKCWTARTKIVTFRNWPPWQVYTQGQTSVGLDDPVSLDGHVLTEIQAEYGHPNLETVLFYKVSWAKHVWNSFETFTFAEFIRCFREKVVSLAAVCHTLVLKEVSVALCDSKANETVAYVHVTSGRVTAGRCITIEDLWQLMDDGLPCLTELDLVLLADWGTEYADREMPGRLINVLNERQSADPREGVNFRGVSWVENDLTTLDLHKLTKLAQHSLLATCAYETLRIVVSW